LTTPQQPASEAPSLKAVKQAFAAKDWTTTFRLIQALDGTPLEAMPAARLLMMSGIALHNLGYAAESTAQFKSCAELIFANKLLSQNPPVAEAFRVAAWALLGAGDLAGLKQVMRAIYADYFAKRSEFRISPVASMSAWCAKHGAVRSVVEESHEVSVRMINGKQLDYRCAPSWFAVIPNAEIAPPWDAVIAPTGEVLEGSNYIGFDTAFRFAPHVHLEGLDRIAHPWAEECDVVDHDALFINTPDSHHFGHWVVDILPRLRAWRHAASPATKIAVPETLPRKHRDTLAGFGVGPQDIIECAEGRRTRFRTLTAVCREGPIDYFIPSARRVRFVHERMAARRTPHPDPGRARRIFLTRAVSTRQIANRAEFDAMLAELNFETLDLAQMSLAEQNNVLPDTGILLGVFGSDLLSIYQLRPGAAVVEIIWDEALDPVVERTCAHIGLDHRFFVNPATQTSRQWRRKGFDRDPVVDCARLKDFLAGLIARGAP
jgi:capsular polysaccharide biosynthesis protein